MASPLAAAIERLDLAALADATSGPVSWLEIVRSADSGLSVAGRQCVDRWAAAGVPVAAAGIAGRPFWIGQSITLVPDLLAATTQAFAEAGA